MKNWLKKALHYLKLIFKKTTLDNVIVSYFIEEVIDNDKAMARIKYLSNKYGGQKVSEQDIENILLAVKNAYNTHF